MTHPVYGWTSPRKTASQRADPSGVQTAGTDVQAWLLPGMATVTDRVRYISLFTAVRRLRQQSRSIAEAAVNVSELMRRVEALIAASSVLHHEDDGDVPGGIIGANAARGLVETQDVRLRLPNRVPAYNIFRGTLGGLGLFDLEQESDPLFEAGVPLGDAWRVEGAGSIGKQLRKGELPASLRRADVQSASESFCLCRVPDHGPEQDELTQLLFALKGDVPPPEYREGRSLTALRSASWALTLLVVQLSPGRALRDETLMNRLLEPDLIEAMPSQSLLRCLLIWRWVAARAFFERGWTVAFNDALDALKGERDGLTRAEFYSECAQRYLNRHEDEAVEELVAEARTRMRETGWLEALHASRSRRDALLLAIAGVESARDDLVRFHTDDLEDVYRSRGISLASEEARLARVAAERRTASEYWAEIAEDTLTQHTKIALRKMSAGNPDSLHVDFDEGRWFVPSKALAWAPRLAGGRSRLDIAIGWCLQLGLLTDGGSGAYTLTRIGEATLATWHEKRAHWP